MESIRLVCTACGEKRTAAEAVFRCPACGEPLEAEERSGSIDRRRLDAFGRYAGFYPESLAKRFKSLGEGGTPLVALPEEGKALEINLYVKNESQNPTWSFKDRGTLTAVAHAKALGFDRIGTVSTGNMAVSTAAYGAAEGLPTVVLVKRGLPREKVGPILAYKPRLIQVDGPYGELYDRSLVLGREKGIYFMNSDVPFRVEGYKTTAYELFEQLGGRVPDWVVVPVSSGGHLRGIEKGFRELKRSGFIDRIPAMVCAQAAGCAPIHEAFLEKRSIRPFKNPETVAKAIANPFPPSGNAVLSLLERTKGTAEAVTDREILQAHEALAGWGLLVQPASAVALAACRKLRKAGRLAPGASVVCLLTGSGLKTPAAFQGWIRGEAEACPLSDLQNRL